MLRADHLTLFVIMNLDICRLPIYSSCLDPYTLYRLLAKIFETQQLIFFEFLAHATVQFRIVHHPYVTVTHLTKFSFRHLA